LDGEAGSGGRLGFIDPSSFRGFGFGFGRWRRWCEGKEKPTEKKNREEDTEEEGAQAFGGRCGWVEHLVFDDVALGHGIHPRCLAGIVINIFADSLNADGAHGMLKGFIEFVGMLEAILGFFGEGFGEQGFEDFGVFAFWVEFTEAGWVGFEVQAHDIAVCWAIKDAMTGEQLCEDNPTSIEVGAMIDALHLTAHLLRGHIKGCADGCAPLAELIIFEALLEVLPDHAGNSKVHDLDEQAISRTHREDHIFGLEVAVDDPAFMGIREGIKELRKEGVDPTPLEVAVQPPQTIKALAFEPFADQVRPDLLRDTKVDDLDDILVSQFSRNIGFLLETFMKLFVFCPLGLEKLDRKGILQGHMACFVHLTKAASADSANKAIISNHLAFFCPVDTAICLLRRGGGVGQYARSGRCLIVEDSHTRSLSSKESRKRFV
jgi:hypothetical protein